MKRILIAMLALLGTMNLAAQAVEDGEAFYIYRNDGDFNGFFYDDVLEMRYSKVGTDTVEYDHYVVQEVVTADSVYRIPLTAIDSIGFVQPEIKLNPRLKVIDGTGLENYIQVWGMHYLYNIPFVTFSPDVPDVLLPQVGDVIVGLDDALYKETSNGTLDGLAGRVTEVVRERFYTQLKLAPLSELSDVFVQFISVEQVGTAPSGQVRRRMAGLSTMQQPRRASGNFGVSLINFSGTLQKEWKPNSKTSISFGLNLGAELKLSMVYNITWTRFFVKLMFDESFEVGGSIKAAVETGAEEDFPFGPTGDMEIKFPAALPMFGVKPVPKAFVRSKGELSATVNFPKFQWGSTQTIIFDNKAEKFATGYLSDKDCPGDDEADLFSGVEGGIAWNGFFQTGVKEDATVNTNSWFKGIFYTSYGMEIYAGPKLEGELNLSVNGLTDDGAYGLLKDSKIEYSPFCVDLENKARMQYLWHDPEERTFWSSTKKFGTATWYLFPEFKKTDAEYNETTGVVSAAVHPRRQVFWKSWVGAGIYNKDGQRIAERFKEDESYNLVNTFNEFKAEFSNIPAGHHSVRPLLRTLGCVVSAESAEEKVDVLPEMKLNKDSITFDAKGGLQYVNFETNAPNIEVRAWGIYQSPYIYHLGSNSWIDTYTPSVEDDGQRSFGISTTEDRSLFGRQARILVAGYEEDLWKRDTLQVHQMGSGVAARISIETWDEANTLDAEGIEKGKTHIADNQIYESVPCTCVRNGDLLTISFNYPSENVVNQTDINIVYTESFDISGQIMLDLHSNYNARILGGNLRKVKRDRHDRASGVNNQLVTEEWNVTFGEAPLRFTTHNGGGLCAEAGDYDTVGIVKTGTYSYERRVWDSIKGESEANPNHVDTNSRQMESDETSSRFIIKLYPDSNSTIEIATSSGWKVEVY